MLKKQTGELEGNASDANELFTKGASVKLLAGKADVGSKELSKVSLNNCVLLECNFLLGSCNHFIGPCVQSNTINASLILHNYNNNTLYIITTDFYSV